MNTVEIINHATSKKANADVKSGTCLLDSIQAIQARVGEGLNESELTWLLWENRLPSEAGFRFLNFSEGFVALSVPPQNLADWYPAEGWIVPDKERIAQTIAAKQQLSLSEPPDKPTSTLCPPSSPPKAHHHFEFSSRWETVIVAHPCYLKVRLVGAKSDSLLGRPARNPLHWGSELLSELSALYQVRTQPPQTPSTSTPL